MKITHTKIERIKIVCLNKEREKAFAHLETNGFAVTSSGPKKAPANSPKMLSTTHFVLHGERPLPEAS